MFGFLSTKKEQREFVQTPDGPGVVTGSKDGIYRVKLKKAPGRPRQYRADQLSPVVNPYITEDAGIVTKIAIGDTAGAVAGFGVKKALGAIFKWRARNQTGY